MHKLWNAIMMPIMLIYQLHRRRLSISIVEQGRHERLFEIDNTNNNGALIEALECADLLVL